VVALAELGNSYGIVNQLVRKMDRPVSGEEDSSPNVYMLDLGKRVGKSWHPVFHVSLLKKYHRDEKELHLWQENLRPPPDYELWDGAVGKVTAILDSRQIHG
jgi:hypothetical protein